MAIEMKTIRVPLSYAIQEVGNTSTKVTSGTIYLGQYSYGSTPFSAYNSYSAYFVFKNIPDLRNYYWTSAKLVNLLNGACKYVTYTKSNYSGWIRSETDLSITSGSIKIYTYAGDENQSGAGTIISSNYGSFNLPIRQNTIDLVCDYGAINNPVYGYYNTDYTASDKASFYRDSFINIEQICLEIEYYDVPVSVKTLYPNDVYVKNNKTLTFEWLSELEPYKYGSIEPQEKDPSKIYITSNKLEVWDDDNHSKEYNFAGDANTYTMSLDDIAYLGNGNIYYKVSATASNEQSGEVSSQFIFLGESDAPDILSVSQDSFPTVTWECDDQISWQMVIKNGDELIYDSGMKAGSDKSYKIPVFLEDGVYSIEMRALNNYGYYTPWNSSVFTLNPPKPQAATNIIVSANNDYSVSFNCTEPSVGKLYVVRRKDSNSKVEIIGEYSKTFVDNHIPLNTTYEYTIRNYSQGYKDGEWIDATIKSDGVIIRKADNLSEIIKVYMSESEFDVIKNESKSDSLIQVIGRSYPILELGEWITSTRSFSGCVSESDFNKLLVWTRANANVVLQSNGEVFHCYLSITDNGKHVSGNRIVSFELTRIDGD